MEKLTEAGYHALTFQVLAQDREEQKEEPVGPKTEAQSEPPLPACETLFSYGDEARYVIRMGLGV